MSLASISGGGRIRLRGRLAAVVLVLACLAGCRGHDDGQGDRPAVQGAPGPAATARPTPNGPLALLSAHAAQSDDGSQLELAFNGKLAAAQVFDDLVAVTGPDGEVVSGS